MSRRTQRTVQAGFTLVELLVVIAIIGALVALLLPAIQAARESSRRTACQNNLRQSALGSLNFEQQHGALPIGCLGYANPIWGEIFEQQKLISWNVQLLPFLEQNALASEYRLDVPSYLSPNKELGRTVLAVFLCPSTAEEDKTHSTSGAWREQAFTDYGGIYGVEGEQRDSELGAEARQNLNDASLGVMLYNDPVALSQIADGTSYTAALAELAPRRISTTEWASGHNIFAQLDTNPVNGAAGFDNEIASPHPGGALVAFCDGHVDFVADDVEQQYLNAMLTRSGDDSP